MKPVLIAAVDFELKPTVQLLTTAGIEHEVLFCGVGCFAPLKNIPRHFEELKDRDVIYVGTCGIASSFTGVELVTTHLVRWYPLCERFGTSYPVSGCYPQFNLSSHLSLFSSPLRSLPVFCSSHISKEQPLAEPLYCENLELYSLLQVLPASLASFTPILAITNALGPSAHDQWSAHHREAAAATGRYLHKQLTSKPPHASQ